MKNKIGYAVVLVPYVKSGSSVSEFLVFIRVYPRLSAVAFGVRA